MSLCDTEDISIPYSITEPLPAMYPLSKPIINSSGATKATSGTYLLCESCPTKKSKNLANKVENPCIDDVVPCVVPILTYLVYSELVILLLSNHFFTKFFTF